MTLDGLLEEEELEEKGIELLMEGVNYTIGTKKGVNPVYIFRNHYENGEIEGYHYLKKMKFKEYFDGFYDKEFTSKGEN